MRTKCSMIQIVIFVNYASLFEFVNFTEFQKEFIPIYSLHRTKHDPFSLASHFYPHTGDLPFGYDVHVHVRCISKCILVQF